MDNEQPSQELLKRELLHWMADLLSLLGADESVVKSVNSFEELPLTKEFVDSIRNYAASQIDSVKTRLRLCHTYTVTRIDPNNPDEE